MPSSVNGWTMPDWSIYDDQQLKDLRAWHQNAINRHENNPAADADLDYWKAHVQSIDVELNFRKLAK
jgi:hypothetical protein